MLKFAKQLEVFLRRIILASLGRLARATHARHGIDINSPRILLVRTDRLGDVIISTPTIAKLRQHYPMAVIDVLLGPKNASAGPLIPFVDSVYAITGGFTDFITMVSRLRQRRYDVCVNLVRNQSTNAILMTLLSGAKMRIGFAERSSRMYNYCIPRATQAMHIVAETSRVLSPFGIVSIADHPRSDADKLSVKLPVDTVRQASHAHNVVVLNISVSDPHKFLGVDAWTQIADGLRSGTFNVLIAGAPGDAPTINEIAHAAHVESLPLTSAFSEFVLRLDVADIVVTCDTSVVHASAALGKPTVVVGASQSAADQWHPWGVPYRIVAGDGTQPMLLAEGVATAVSEIASHMAVQSTTQAQ